jgi:hypothetical protein
MGAGNYNRNAARGTRHKGPISGMTLELVDVLPVTARSVAARYAGHLKYFTSEVETELVERIDEISRMLSGLMKFAAGSKS